MAALTLSNSRANTYRRCQKQYEFKYVKKVRKKDLALPLFRGDWLHQLLMVHHDGHDWKLRHNFLKSQNWDNLFDEEREELGGNLAEEVVRLMKGYLAHYRHEDKLWHTIDTEIDEYVDLPNGMRVNIIIDRIAEDLTDHSLWIWDYKTVSRFYPENFMLLDSQLALYLWGAADQLGYHGLRGAILDELITKPPTLPAELKSGGLAQRKNLHCDAYTYFGELKRRKIDPKPYANYLRFLQSRHDEWWRRTRMPASKPMMRQVVGEMMATGDDILHTVARKRFARTARKECRFDCDYLTPCMAQLQGADIADILKVGYRKSTRPDQEDLKKMWPSQMRKETSGGAN